MRARTRSMGSLRDARRGELCPSPRGCQLVDRALPAVTANASVGAAEGALVVGVGLGLGLHLRIGLPARVVVPVAGIGAIALLLLAALEEPDHRVERAEDASVDRGEVSGGEGREGVVVLGRHGRFLRWCWFRDDRYQSNTRAHLCTAAIADRARRLESRRRHPLHAKCAFTGRAPACADRAARRDTATTAAAR